MITASLWLGLGLLSAAPPGEKPYDVVVYGGTSSGVVAAVQVARQRGLEVDCGAVEDQRYPAAAFDAVTLNHVIEHVPDPLATVAECRRLLKPGGRLLMFTPNAGSLAHWMFGRDWRGLEPPRHLHLFAPGDNGQAL